MVVFRMRATQLQLIELVPLSMLRFPGHDVPYTLQ
jgi:hypothetical protein